MYYEAGSFKYTLKTVFKELNMF